MISSPWKPDSWKTKVDAQAIAYDDPSALEGACARLRELPPLVTSWEIERLKALLACAGEFAAHHVHQRVQPEDHARDAFEQTHEMVAAQDVGALVNEDVAQLVATERVGQPLRQNHHRTEQAHRQGRAHPSRRRQPRQTPRADVQESYAGAFGASRTRSAASIDRAGRCAYV